MPRPRGPMPDVPMGENGKWLLNDLVYGSQDVGGYHQNPIAEACPLNWTEIFGRQADLLVEIGFNRGDFLCDLGVQNPDANVVGIEIRRRFGWGLTELIPKKYPNLQNVRGIWGDAKLTMPVLFAPESIQGLYITFPDPWWKKKHEKRRLVDDAFAQMIVSKIKKGGAIWVKTDVEMIADEIKTLFVNQLDLDAPVSFEAEDLPYTYRERACLKYELPIHRFKLIKKN
jgi:tRNA (guanine-N(7)-)-methyltransferase